MASNTKLTRAQKNELKAFKAIMPKNMAFGTGFGITVLLEVDTSVVRFASSVASMEELKWRRKVGEYNAMQRWQDQQTAIIPRFNNRDSAQKLANGLASMLGG
jgi:hypothetical protein